VTRAQLDKQPREIAEMFDGVADKYDRTNTILSFGRDRFWRAATRDALDLKAGERVLDLGAGTGVSTEELAKSGAYVVGLDISQGMLRAGKRVRPQVPLLAGDALALPFADGVFDAVTISFALRNVHDSGAALAEMARVTKPGGRLVVCEFSHPTNSTFRHAYMTYLMGTLPAVARKVSQQPGRVRVPGRVHPGLAGPARTGRRGDLERLDRRQLAQPDGRDRRVASRYPSGSAKLALPRRVGRMRAVLHCSPGIVCEDFHEH